MKCYCLLAMLLLNGCSSLSYNVNITTNGNNIGNLSLNGNAEKIGYGINLYGYNTNINLQGNVYEKKNNNIKFTSKSR